MRAAPFAALVLSACAPLVHNATPMAPADFVLVDKSDRTLTLFAKGAASFNPVVITCNLLSAPRLAMMPMLDTINVRPLLTLSP